MNRDDLEAAIWHAIGGLKAPVGTRPRRLVVDEILAAADAYATGDSEELTAMRRDVLHAASARPGTP